MDGVAVCWGRTEILACIQSFPINIFFKLLCCYLELRFFQGDRLRARGDAGALQRDRYSRAPSSDVFFRLLL